MYGVSVSELKNENALYIRIGTNAGHKQLEWSQVRPFNIKNDYVEDFN